MGSHSSKISKKKLILAGIAALLILNVIIVIFLNLNFTCVGGSFHRNTLTELDLSGRDVSDISSLTRFTSLKRLNLRDTGITADDYQQLKESLDGCDILWSVPLGDEFFDNDSTDITVKNPSAVTAEQLKAVYFMDSLASLDLSASEINNAAAKKLNQLAEDFPERDFIWNIKLGNKLYSHDVTDITLTSDIEPADFEKLLLLKNLATLDIPDNALDEELSDVTAKLVEQGVVCSVSLAGVKVTSDVLEADISDHIVEDLDLFSKALMHLPNLTKIDMCHCGLSNEQMEILMDRHPTIKFVWTISFVRWTDIRTDITCFSSLNSQTQPYGQEELAPLFKYCTDLVALDIGHSSITDISAITNLTKLQALILGDNDITDISPLGALKELEYLELWGNRDFTDISVLTTLPNLKDINLSYCSGIEDFEPLFNLQSVELLWLQNSGFEPSLVDRLTERYPDCKFSFYMYASSHGNGWHAQERFLGMRKAFMNWQNVEKYTSWDNVEYKENAILAIPYPRW